MYAQLALAGANLLGSAISRRREKRRQAGYTQERIAQAAPLRNNAEALMQGSRQGLTGLQHLAIAAAAGGRPGERAEALGQNSADVAIAASQNRPTSLPGVFDRAMTRARGLSRLARHTSDQFDNALTKERMALVQAGRSRQASSLSGIIDSIGLKTGTLAVNQGAASSGAASRENLLGTLTGLGIGAAPDIQAWNQRRRMANTAIGGTGAGGGIMSSGLGVVS